MRREDFSQLRLEDKARSAIDGWSAAAGARVDGYQELLAQIVGVMQDAVELAIDRGIRSRDERIHELLKTHEALRASAERANDVARAEASEEIRKALHGRLRHYRERLQQLEDEEAKGRNRRRNRDDAEEYWDPEFLAESRSGRIRECKAAIRALEEVSERSTPRAWQRRN